MVEEADGDLMGDGVNIAARLEGIAAPGAICLSEDGYRQVKTGHGERLSGSLPPKIQARDHRISHQGVSDVLRAVGELRMER